MLQTLRIRNLALIDDVELHFADGFNVLTGETGAGKSIIVGALNLILGGRASSDHVRSGASEARVEALFQRPKISKRLAAILEEQGVPAEDGEILLARVVSQQGRSRAYAGGNLMPVGQLARIGGELVNLHGQHEHQSLLKTARQLDLVDAYGGLDKPAADLASQFAAYNALNAEVGKLETDDRERTRQIEFRRFEVSEIEKAQLTAGEEVDLAARRNLLNNAERIHELTSGAHRRLYSSEDEPAAIDAVDGALNALDDLVAIDDSFRDLAQQLAEARASLEAIADELRSHTDDISFDPKELDEINSRLTMIRDLARKYGDTTGEILAYCERGRIEIADFENHDERLAQLRSDRDKKLAEFLESARKLSKKRQVAAKKLASAVTASIDRLGMDGAAFSVEFHETSPGPRGTDQIEFMLAANAGEPAKPLKKVASGGEMSRLMLALKSTFATADDIPTLIFDEIDAGVGGAVAGQVAERITKLSATHQIICVTHLPQIAAAANRHFNVAKTSAKGRTQTHVHVVEDTSRVDEVARLLDGKATEVSIRHAEALLRNNAS